MSIRRSFSVPKERRRFEDAHKKMFDAMDSIDIAEEKKRLRQQQFQNAVPDAIKRLATPKAQRVRARSVDVSQRSKAAKPQGSSTTPKRMFLPKVMTASKVDTRQLPRIARMTSASPAARVPVGPKPRSLSDRLQRLNKPVRPSLARKTPVPTAASEHVSAFKAGIKQRVVAARKSPMKASTDVRDASKPRPLFERIQRSGTQKRTPFAETQPTANQTAMPCVKLESGVVVSLEKVTFREPYEPLPKFSMLK